jgi:hypothetical protein
MMSWDMVSTISWNRTVSTRYPRKCAPGDSNHPTCGLRKCSDARLRIFGDVGWASGQVLSFRGTTEHLFAAVPSVGFLMGWKWVVGGEPRATP